MKFVIVCTILILLTNGMARVNDLMVMILIDQEWQRGQETFKQEAFEDDPPVAVAEQTADPVAAAGTGHAKNKAVPGQPPQAAGDPGEV